MKKLAVLMVGLLLSSNAFTQNTKVNESTEKVGDGIHPAFITYIFESTADEVEKEWKSLMKDFKSEKISGKDGIYADNIIIPAITDGTMDVYARTEKIKENETKLIVAFDMGGAYISSGLNNKIVYDAAIKLVADFAHKTTRNVIVEKLKEAQKAFDKLNEQQKELEEKNSDLNKDIENYKSKIHKAEEDIETNKTNREKKKSELEAQRKIVDEFAIKEKNSN